jgi:signal transduction histidine kinase
VPPDDERPAIVEAFWQAVEDGDEARLRKLCADEFTVSLSNGRTSDFEEWTARLRGEAAIEAFDDFEIVVEEVVAGEEGVAVRGREQRTQVEPFVGVEPGDGDVAQPFSGVFEFDGDEVESVRLVVDEARFLRDLGVLPGDGLAWKLRQQHRDVLNRILRHDLRNDLNAAMLRAEEIPEKSLRREVIAPIEQLLALVEKTREVDLHVVEQELYPRSVDVPDLVLSVVDDLTDSHPEASVTTRFDQAGATVRTDPAVLETVLVECIENALVHVEGPEVTATVDGRADGITVTVADDGPGVSDYELAAIRQERETPIVHGSGVGLWAIKWGAEKLDGDVTFDVPETGGTVVTLDVPELE